MTQNKFNQIKDNFSKYEGREVEFTYYIPSADMYATNRGYLIEVGTECNEGHFIIQSGCLRACIYHKNVKLLPQITLKKDGTILMKKTIGTWKCTNVWKERGGRHDRSGNLLVHYIWEAELDNGCVITEYSRKELIHTISRATLVR